METNPVAGIMSPAAARTIFTFKVPVAMQERLKTPIATMGLVKLTVDEEITAAKLAHGEGASNAFALLKQSLVAVNGKKVTLADGTAEGALNAMDPAVRALCIKAYESIHSPKEDEAADFLGSVSASL